MGLVSLKETPWDYLTLLRHERVQGEGSLQARKGPCQNSTRQAPGLQLPELWEVNLVFVSHPVCYFVITAHSKALSVLCKTQEGIKKGDVLNSKRNPNSKDNRYFKLHFIL